MSFFDPPNAADLPPEAWEIGLDDLLDPPDNPSFDPTAPAFLAAAVAEPATAPSSPESATAPSSPETATAPSFPEPATPIPTLLDILTGANLGFTAALAEAVLGDHRAVVFLGRLWDAARIDGAAVGSPRVPPRLWALADEPSAAGKATARLLEATGLRVPPDFGQQLDFHLNLWAKAGSLPVRGLPVDDAAPLVRCDGPIWVEARLAPGGVDLELRGPFPGRFETELHWPDGTSARHTTPSLAAGQLHTFTVPREAPELPTSIRVTRGVATT
ncbi:MAG: hypothetical protein LBJ08_02860 [Bifidobacteriaceae bacterium]|nr:hypothetical protein [Bifidobacteriaceae bacterium]